MNASADRLHTPAACARQGLRAGLLSLALFAPAVWGPSSAAAVAPGSLAELAQAADAVALVQVRDTDYLRRREIPVSGSAYLGVLIAYKPDEPGDLLEVYERGLHAQECYFPNPTVFEEGRRYLVFLRRDSENPERFRGLPQGCAIDVLVGRDNRYAVRMPVDGLALAEAQREVLRALAQPLDFSDPYAVVDDEALTPAERDAMRAAGQIAPYPAEPPDDGAPAATPLPPSPSTPRQWSYTRGIPLERFSDLLELEPTP